MSRAQRLLRWFYTLESHRMGASPLQAGALCWRMTAGGPEILLITSRKAGRWGVPKGWSFRGRPLHRTAEREAWEEAGVIGRTENRMLGPIPATKRYRLAGEVQWQLTLFPLEVERLAEDWPERPQRQRRWFAVPDALRLVRPKSLRAILQSFAASLAAEQRQTGGSEQQDHPRPLPAATADQPQPECSQP